MRPHEHFKFHTWPAPSLYWTSLYATLQQNHPARINLAAHEKDFPRGLRNGRYVHPVQFLGIMPIQKQSQTDNVYAGTHFGSSYAECKGPDVEPNFPFPPKQEKWPHPVAGLEPSAPLPGGVSSVSACNPVGLANSFVSKATGKQACSLRVCWGTSSGDMRTWEQHSPRSAGAATVSRTTGMVWVPRGLLQPEHKASV